MFVIEVYNITKMKFAYYLTRGTIKTTVLQYLFNCEANIKTSYSKIGKLKINCYCTVEMIDW